MEARNCQRVTHSSMPMRSPGVEPDPVRPPQQRRPPGQPASSTFATRSKLISSATQSTMTVSPAE